MTTVAGKTSYSIEVLSDVSAYLEINSSEPLTGLDGKNAYYSYLLIIEGEPDILLDDQVIDQNGNQYSVKGITPFKDNTDIPNHTECLLYRKI